MTQDLLTAYQISALQGGKIDFHKMITKLPFEMHLPGHSFTGPGTRLDKRLDANDNPLPHSAPINRVDAAAYRHDLAYRDAGEALEAKHQADRQMIAELDAIQDPTIRERIDRLLAKNAMKAKLAIGASLAKELHKPYRKPKEYLAVQVFNKNDIWTADIMFLSRPKLIALIVMDCYTRYLWTEPIPNKNASSVKAAFEKIVKRAKAHPKKLWVDQGKEFYNNTLKTYLSSLSPSVELYSTHNEGKAVMAERVIRTLKEKMYKLKTDLEKPLRSWTPLLQRSTSDYNHSVHSSIGKTPTVADKDPDSIREIVSDHNFEKKTKKYKFKIGDRVRIFKYKTMFEKGYTTKWTTEIFVIDKVLETSPITYQIRDLNNEPILGKFYAEELQKTDY